MPYPDIKPPKWNIEDDMLLGLFGKKILLGAALGTWFVVRYVLMIDGLWMSMLTTVLILVALGCALFYFHAEWTELRDRKLKQPHQ
jgi:CHASE2 domain-containing sensor protein